jgi:hypothetical protein
MSNAVFSTRLALVIPGSVPAAVMLRYQNPWGGVAAPSFATTIPPLTRITIDPAPMPGVDAGDFSTVVESDTLVVVDRTVSVHGVGHGSAAETAIVQPSTTWRDLGRRYQRPRHTQSIPTHRIEEVQLFTAASQAASESGQS